MVDEKFNELVNKILEVGGDKVLFVILYGSRAEGYARSTSDYDIAIYYEDIKEERYKFLSKLWGKIGGNYDLRIFQDLPLVLKSKILKNGKFLYIRDFNKLFKIANAIRKEYEDFRPRLQLILGDKEWINKTKRLLKSRSDK
ncbi:MAG: type VII toxin-antitoxin system MntA family adenylyltransferase antitoxin [Candidatus Njordarchaeia archaeon]